MRHSTDTRTAETADTLLGGRVHIAQAARGYRVSVDAILLAASVPAPVAAMDGVRVLDVGCGDGGATLCLAWRLGSSAVHGIDLRPEAVARLTESITANGFSARVAAGVADVADGPGAELEGSFDWVMSNPPYLPAQRADLRAADADVAMVETVPLDRWIAFMAGCAREGGHLAVVHRADRIDELLAALHPLAGDVHIFPVWPHTGDAARRVIVHARKGAHGPARLCAGLVLHHRDGSYTEPARAVLEGGAALEIT